MNWASSENSTSARSRFEKPRERGGTSLHSGSRRSVEVAVVVESMGASTAIDSCYNDGCEHRGRELRIVVRVYGKIWEKKKKERRSFTWISAY